MKLTKVVCIVTAGSSVVALSFLISDTGKTQVPASFISLQGASPGSAQAGHLNITGTGLFDKIGVGISNPGVRLDVNGQFRCTGFRLNSGGGLAKVLTSDASGNGTWQTPAPAILTLPYSGSGSSGTAPLFLIDNSGDSPCIRGISHAPTGTGLQGWAIENSGNGVGVYGLTDGDNNARGVLGRASSASATSFGGYFESAGDGGTGVYGEATSETGNTYGGVFTSRSINGIGLYGYSSGLGIANRGVVGVCQSPNGIGVYGYNNNSTGFNYGGFFVTPSPDGIGVYGGHEGGGDAPGVSGVTDSDSMNATGVSGTVSVAEPGGYSAGVRGTINYGLAGSGVSGSHFGSGLGGRFESYEGNGLLGRAQAAVSDKSGVIGEALGHMGSGVFGHALSTSGVTYGVRGSSESEEGYGVYGQHQGNGFTPGVYGTTASTSANATGVIGEVLGTDPGAFSAGVLGISNATNGEGIGVWGTCDGSGYGGFFTAHQPGGTGVVGLAFGTTGISYGVIGQKNNAISYGGYFDRLDAGVATAAVKAFRIDHPLDPENKYLWHSSVESPDMMNVYNGNTVTDATGDAWVELPDYFESLNRDFRYQLTVIGQFAQAIIGSEIKGNQFLIRTDKPRVKVSWQVTGIRHDPIANKYRIVPETNKSKEEIGKYLLPDAFDKGEESGIHFRKQMLSSKNNRKG